ncbi:MAG: hypothetical protein A2233_05465 [Candidatus Kerfeldbacteria bacterium RIFOXYA2_FULL_38_24]|uniref:Nucleotidyltransferase n=1 Tax=Candidatus Kerfeldbacteria bacterium RIFOXYB2_FULL_38_14 TaxID=1798547 RepID=A0A1G2BGT4_9BACT|nr:MAG: hypothetical protein A2233_05465 [Candidatus Kerfeldbacteria bacterium RIFOXYA2_FULL_38_24]OGY88275.1 MAG: hypothetical protein A2319_03750 [Candidatus Kerfeldbacteria bacterium RIFOXYB2_FULL_38_14]OGY89648.1 MAG: hypothetical protein A2458_04300 [Candidatus Kerfeldbacteria bacterium RIFOXYC2_FULL_38_9]
MKEIIESFKLSVQRFEEILQEKPSISIHDASIQRFEFTTELAWKSIQKFLRNEEIVCRSPKQCLKEAFSFELVEDDERWIAIMEDRNLTSHTYNETTAEEVYKRLPNYLPLFKKLLSSLEKNIK